MKQKPAPPIQWGPCCFCGLTIEPSPLDPCRLIVETSEGRRQIWFCHAACFRERLTNDPMLEPAII